MMETVRFYQSQDGQFKLSKYIAGRLLEPTEAVTLLERKYLGPLDGFRSRMGRPFTAALKLNEEGKVEFVFDESGAGGGETIDFSQQQPVGVCPVDGARVYEGSMAFVCEHSVKKPATCTFRIGKKILSQEISAGQVAKILTEGKSDLLLNFVSQRTKRKFKAFLVLQEGKVKFEFPPREEKAKGAKAKKVAAPKKSTESDEN
jgi:DNA topoisomerase-3